MCNSVQKENIRKETDDVVKNNNLIHVFQGVYFKNFKIDTSKNKGIKVNRPAS